MGDRQIRLGQLIAPFGPGSIYTDRNGIPYIVCGLDHWFKRYFDNKGLTECEDKEEFLLFEPRLSALLHVASFYSPPDYRVGPEVSNAYLNIPAQRFPCWYRNTHTGEMHEFNLHQDRIPRPEDGGRWQPVRFIAMCSAGHICEFPWKRWIECDCPNDEGLRLTDRGGSELTSITIRCETCSEGSLGRRGRTLAGTTIKPDVTACEQSAFQRAGIPCPGGRPWLGQGAEDGQCDKPLIAAMINQTNLYFPLTVSSIALPAAQPQAAEITELRKSLGDLCNLGVARTLWNASSRRDCIQLARGALQELNIAATDKQIEQALESLFDISPPPTAKRPSRPESEVLEFRRAEFNVLSNEIDDPEQSPDLRVICSAVPNQLSNTVSRVRLVERLKETRAFYGFDRLEQSHQGFNDMPDGAMHQLFRTPPNNPLQRWLPAIAVFGEGIYIELNEERVLAWQRDHNEWLKKRLNNAFINRLAAVSKTLPPLEAPGLEWASRYMMVHSLAHILINQLVFECGYSTASLRERLYISSDPTAPMAAFMIYTAAGDSEGTLGGLVELGRPERLWPSVQRAINRASWCSADPVCSEQMGGQGSKLVNLAACHACVLLPETSCETINQGLDRALVVGTPDERFPGFLSSLIE